MSILNPHKKHAEPRFAIVSQEPALFNRSVNENIKYNLSCTSSDIKQAAKIADAYTFIEEGNFGSTQHTVTV